MRISSTERIVFRNFANHRSESRSQVGRFGRPAQQVRLHHQQPAQSSSLHTRRRSSRRLPREISCPCNEARAAFLRLVSTSDRSVCHARVRLRIPGSSNRPPFPVPAGAFSQLGQSSTRPVATSAPSRRPARALCGRWPTIFNSSDRWCPHSGSLLLQDDS